MKTLNSTTKSRLKSAATTLAWCWKLTRRDGRIFGFTDHDRAIRFNNLDYRPDLGFDMTVIDRRADFATGSSEVSGIVNSPALSAKALANGAFDGAKIEIWRVDWQSPDQYSILLARAEIGEIENSGQSFRAELRGLAHMFERPGGRIYSHLCDADLFDQRCRADRANPDFTCDARLVRANGGHIIVRPVRSIADNAFAGGHLECLAGQVVTKNIEISSHYSLADGTVRVFTFAGNVDLPQNTQQLRLVTGCDKQLLTCHQKFANAKNFQGFPHIPGSDFLFRLPRRSASAHDGGPLYPRLPENS